MSSPVEDWGPLIGPSTAIFTTLADDPLEPVGELCELHADATRPAPAKSEPTRPRKALDGTDTS
jgi:hypothetical protein